VGISSVISDNHSLIAFETTFSNRTVVDISLDSQATQVKYLKVIDGANGSRSVHPLGDRELVLMSVGVYSFA